MVKFLTNGNRIVFKTKENKYLENSTYYENLPIEINGADNYVELYVDNEQDINRWIDNKGFHISICGDRNKVILGDIMIGYNPALGITGFNLIIGGGPDPWIDPDMPRNCDDCKVTIGDHTLINGVVMYLQDDQSAIKVGNDCMFSWGIDVWCTDVHTITDLKGQPVNFGREIEIGNHVWIGKDVKIGKNTKICDDSIVGWNSLVTKKFDETNVVIAGVPAKIVKHDVNWDGRCIRNYIAYNENNK